MLGIELNEERAANLVAQRFNVKVADATDTDFWNMVRLSEPIEEMVLLAMPNHHSNIYAAERIQASGLDCVCLSSQARAWNQGFHGFAEAP